MQVCANIVCIFNERNSFCKSVLCSIFLSDVRLIYDDIYRTSAQIAKLLLPTHNRLYFLPLTMMKHFD